MSILQAHTPLIQQFQATVVTAASLNCAPDTQRVLQWNQVLDNRLVEWGRAFDLGEEGLIPPTRESLYMAVQLVLRYRGDPGMPAPTRVVPSGDGGIIFELDYGHLEVAIEIDAKGGVEGRSYRNGQLVERRQIP